MTMPKRITISIFDNYLTVTSGSRKTLMDSCAPMNRVWTEYHTTIAVLNGLESGECTPTWHGFGVDGPNVRNYVTFSQQSFSLVMSG